MTQPNEYFTEKQTAEAFSKLSKQFDKKLEDVRNVDEYLKAVAKLSFEHALSKKREDDEFIHATIAAHEKAKKEGARLDAEEQVSRAKESQTTARAIPPAAIAGIISEIKALNADIATTKSQLKTANDKLDPAKDKLKKAKDKSAAAYKNVSGHLELSDENQAIYEALLSEQLKRSTSKQKEEVVEASFKEFEEATKESLKDLPEEEQKEELVKATTERREQESRKNMLIFSLTGVFMRLAQSRKEIGEEQTEIFLFEQKQNLLRELQFVRNDFIDNLEEEYKGKEYDADYFARYDAIYQKYFDAADGLNKSYDLARTERKQLIRNTAYLEASRNLSNEDYQAIINADAELEKAGIEVQQLETDVQKLTEQLNKQEKQKDNLEQKLKKEPGAPKLFMTPGAVKKSKEEEDKLKREAEAAASRTKRVGG